MEEVWRRGRATVREVFDALNKGSRERAYTTIMTIMVRLDRKGLLTRERQGRSDVYSPQMNRAAYLDARASAEVSAVIAQFGDLALAHFADHIGELPPDQLAELRRVARGD